MKKILTSAIAIAISTASVPSFAADYTLKLGHLANESHVWNLAAEKFSNDVAEKSNGRLKIDIYPNSQLGGELDTINGIQLGTVDMTITGESLQNWAPKAAMMAIPYAFRDAEHMAKAANGEIGAEIEQQITERTGLVPVAWFTRGPRNLTSNRPIKKPADLQRMTLRVPNVPIFVSVWNALGAQPTPMAFNEVFTALQQGTIQGQENPLSLIKSASFSEVQKYVNQTEHVMSWLYVVVGKRQLEKLPADLKEIFLEAAQDMQVYQHKLERDGEAQLKVDLQDAGMTFVEVDKAAFSEKALPAVRKALSAEQLALFEKIEQL